MSLIKNHTIVSADWLKEHLNDDNLIILDATIPKVTSNNKISLKEKFQIKNTVFFDIKKQFSDTKAEHPNTILSPKIFKAQAQKLGIKKNSFIVVYDDLGIYSSPRVWWMFQLMGFKNIAVLDGGLPEWKIKGYPIELRRVRNNKKGDFDVNYQAEKIKNTDDVLAAVQDHKIIIADARSKGRFYGTVQEPRKDVKGGHIPNSISLPYSDLISDYKLKPKDTLKTIFHQINPESKEFVFTCGTGITAAILALAAEVVGYKKYAVYDGSWTEWGSTKGLPIEK